ncbi:hypothetical protein D9M72_571120 [compost metagenome]
MSFCVQLVESFASPKAALDPKVFRVAVQRYRVGPVGLELYGISPCCLRLIDQRKRSLNPSIMIGGHFCNDVRGKPGADLPSGDGQNSAQPYSPLGLNLSGHAVATVPCSLARTIDVHFPVELIEPRTPTTAVNIKPPPSRDVQCGRRYAGRRPDLLHHHRSPQRGQT